jgi:ribonuclease R
MTKTNLKKSYSGVIFQGKAGLLIKPDDANLPLYHLKPTEKYAAFRDCRVIFRLSAGGKQAGKPEIQRIIRPDEALAFEKQHLLEKNGISAKFPPAVLAQAQDYARTETMQMEKGRVDLRDQDLVTIDPEDAKDFDDAVSVQQRWSGGWEIGVHIADVSYYVQANSPLDKEAVRRGTSIYLPGLVIPMLPPVLSEGLCSLRPLEDRRAISCVVTLDRQFKIVSQKVFRSLIRSKQRLTYQEAQGIIDDKKDKSPRAGMLRLMKKAADGLHKIRMARGSLDLDIPDSRVVFDREGFPVDIVPEDDSATHGMIEDYMLLANEVVAGMLLEKYSGQAVFRVHGLPKTEELQELCSAWKRPYYATQPLRTMQGLLQGFTDKRERQIFGKVILRVMDRARYHPTNTGHFGLALEKYTHFTSPIRRYPDLLVHRLLLAPAGRYPVGKELTEICTLATEQEQRAQHMEWEADDLMACALMKDRVGEEFTAHIAGVTAGGLFIILDRPPVEGRLGIRELKDDYYLFDEATMSYKGERKGFIYKIGDRVGVRLSGVNLPRRQIDFTPLYRGNTFKLDRA